MRTRRVLRPWAWLLLLAAGGRAVAAPPDDVPPVPAPRSPSVDPLPARASTAGQIGILEDDGRPAATPTNPGGAAEPGPGGVQPTAPGVGPATTLPPLSALNLPAGWVPGAAPRGQFGRRPDPSTDAALTPADLPRLPRRPPPGLPRGRYRARSSR